MINSDFRQNGKTISLESLFNSIIKLSSPFMKLLMLFFVAAVGLMARAATFAPVIEIEEEVYTNSNSNNGAGPMWCHGSTCLVRSGDHLFATGLETVPDVKPLNNGRMVLFERQPGGWERVHVDQHRTREPAPAAAFSDGRNFISVNPTLGNGPEPNGGPARPDVLEFRAEASASTPVSSNPAWQGTPPFAEHSYRSFAADGRAKELILFQNIGYTHAEWSYRDLKDRWSAQGQLKWPWGANYDKPEPIRVCYPNVAIHNRGVYFCGVSDVVEPYIAWREFKRQLTGKEWDYDFRRLFFTWTPDIAREPFAAWVEIASRDKTCGWIMPDDLYVDPKGDVHLLWSERAIDERLRPKFFPGAKQSYALNLALVRRGQVVRRQMLEESTEDKPGIVGSEARFQVTPDRRLFVVYYATGVDLTGNQVSENRIAEVLKDGTLTPPKRLPLKKPFTG